MTEGEPTTTPEADVEVDGLPWAQLADTSQTDPIADAQQARLRAWILDEPYEPPRVGRFTLLHKIGEGGMGAVYAAYDDELDRKVALKFLHASEADDDRAIHRLLREAQALAKLSHPNLVPVFDVGRFEDRVYLAMELVPGQTMRQWSAEEGRSWQDVVARWVEVGRALVMVHDAGMVHRDIKPDNVLVGDDGRARLVDFGLARAQGSTGSAARPPADLEVTHRTNPETTDATPMRGRLGQSVTQTRAVVGTPAYMAPEARLGAPATEASDQYSLCVSLYASLWGTRPSGPTVEDDLVDVPDPSRAPPAVRRALSRGLALNPEGRHPSVHALVEALAAELGRPRRRRRTIVAALLLAGLGVAVGRLSDDTATAAPCDTAREALAGTWDDEQRLRVEGALSATKLPRVDVLTQDVLGRLDDHAERWLDARQRVCEATRVRHVQSDTLLDRRMACLDRQHATLAAVVEAARRVDATRAARLPRSVAMLDAPEDCELPALAESRLSPPPLALRSEVADLRRALAQVRVDAILDGTVGPRQRADRLREDALQLGYEPLHAEAELALGHLAFLADDPRGRAHLERAEALAEASGDDLLKETALRLCTQLVADLGTDPEAPQRLWVRNEATLRRLGQPALRMAHAHHTQLMLALREGDADRSEAMLREEIERWRAQGDAFATMEATAWRSLADLDIGRRRLPQAEQALDDADRLDARWASSASDRGLVGTRLGKVDLLRGMLAKDAGRMDEAQRRLTRALERSVAAYGPKSVPVGRVHVALGDLAASRGDDSTAMTHARAADASFRHVLGDDHPLRYLPLSALGTAAFYLDRFDLAVQAFDEALRLQLRVLPPDHRDVAIMRGNLGEALVALGRHDDAMAPLRSAIATMERTLSPDDVSLSFPVHALGEAALAQGRPAQACTHARRALDLRTQHDGNPVELARTRWLLARCQAAQGQRADAETHAQAAREAFSTMGEGFADELAAIDALLAGR